VLGVENGVVGTSIPLNAQTLKINDADRNGFGADCDFGDCNMKHEIVSVKDGQDTVERYKIGFET